jgi:hypothetical protein
MLRRHDGKTFAPRALVFKTGCADAYVNVAHQSPMDQPVGALRQRNPTTCRGQRGDESNEHRIEVRLPEADPQQDHPRRWGKCGKQI